MIPLEEEPPEIHQEFLQVLQKNGVDAAASVVED
jgi:hypothetical protein